MHEYFKTNQKLWDAKTAVHKDSDFYDLENFKKGATSLKQYELDALGNVHGKSLLHLQCHFGLDSMSFARMGAQVTGIDLSSKSIELARELNAELGLDAKFVESNVLELDKNLEGQFDIVFTSYGTIGWLPDLDQWAKVVNHFLKPGGIFYIIDFHPFLYMFDWDKHVLRYPYFNIGEPFEDVEEGTYADKDSNIALKEYFWQHSIAEPMNALMNQGLQLVHFDEYVDSPYNCVPNMVELENGNYYYGKKELMIPHLFSIKATKQV